MVMPMQKLSAEQAAQAARIINEVIGEFGSEIDRLPKDGVDAETITSLKKRMEGRCRARLAKWGLAA